MCDNDFEERIYFVDCTCDHEMSEHGWGECEVEDCECVGGFEE